MQIPRSIIATSSLLTVALAANTVTFVNQDGLNRTIITTPGKAQVGLPTRTLAGHSTEVYQIPHGWHGNMYTVIDGEKDNGDHQLAEFSFNTWSGLTFFDISSVDSPLDVNNIKMIMPARANIPTSGCQNYPGCDNAYNWDHDDLHSIASFETDLIVFVGTLATTTRSPTQDAPIPPQ